MFEYVHHVTYVVSDMDDAARILGDVFELQLAERRSIPGEHPVEMASYRCGPTLIEVLRPIHHPDLERFLREHGPGLHRVAYAVRDLPAQVDRLRGKGCYVGQPFVAGTGWRIAYFDLERSNPSVAGKPLPWHHLADAE